MPKLTKTYVDRLRPRERRYEVGCSALQGFVIRVNVDGSKTAVVRYFRDGRARRLKLGRIGEHFPVDRARTEAGRILRAVERGEDPARDRERLRHAPTFAYVAERYLAEVGRPYRKASTVRNYEAMLRNHLASTLGPMRVEAIERTDVLRLHQEIGREAPGAANRVAAFVSVVMTHAETWGYRPMRTNPCYKIPKFKGRKMERFLDPEERARLDEVLCEGEAAPLGHPNHLGPSTVAAIRLLLLTGARRGEITALEWSMVDLERACLRLPDSKTGAKVIPCRRLRSRCCVSSGRRGGRTSATCAPARPGTGLAEPQRFVGADPGAGRARRGAAPRPAPQCGIGHARGRAVARRDRGDPGAQEHADHTALRPCER